MKYAQRIGMAVSIVVLAGCASSMIGERVGADQIVVAEPVHVKDCKSLGRSTLGVMAGYGNLMTRSPADVDANLLQMARNTAVDMQADTVVKGPSPEFGKRTFEFYRCKK